MNFIKCSVLFCLVLIFNTTLAFADGANDDSLLLDGARKAAIDNANTVAVGTFDSDDVLAVKAKLGKTYMSKLKDVALCIA